MQLKICDIEVATAAPTSPMPRGNINSQSRNTFSTAPDTVHIIEYAGLPSALMIVDAVWENMWNGSPIVVMERYDTA